MSRSRAVILYSANSIPMAVEDGVAIPANTRALLLAGTHGGVSRLMKVVADGSVAVQAEGRAADGAAPVGNPLFLAGTDGSVLRGLLTDAFGRLVVSPTSPGTKEDIRKLTSLAAGGISFTEFAVPSGKKFQASLFHGGSGSTGYVALGKHDPSVVSFIANGDFESAGQITPWAAVTGSFTAPTPDSNSTQFQTGAAAMRWTYASSSTALQRRQTFSPVLDLTLYRYLRVKFFNDAATGTTRTISIVISSGTPTRTYSLSGTLGSAPFTANTWITLEADLENPTGTTGTGFDLTAVDTISLKMQDGANKTGTVYWDTLRLEDQFDPRHRIYVNGQTGGLNLNPAEEFLEDELVYLVLKNTSSQKQEMLGVVSGYLVDA